MITKLPRDVVDRIAAGEVVERPASVVKELVENALDAGAASVDVAIEGGGLRLVRVADDGSGIDASDLPLAFASHATSKLTDVDDLFHIASFGFRGEALSSIAAVARAAITSSTDGREGRRVVCEASEVAGPEPASGRRGTVVEVRDLFFNTPARRRFLGAERTEGARCREVVAAMSLAHPDVRFTFASEERTLLTLPAGGSLRERIATIHGADTAEQLVPVAGAVPGASVEGLLSLPAAARPRPRLQHVFVNGRLVGDRGIAAAVRSACRDFLPGTLQPSFVLQLVVDPRRLDVNVHPTKAEVRFRDRDEVFRLVRRACRDALLGADLAPHVPLQAPPARGDAPAAPPAPGDLFTSGRVADPASEELRGQGPAGPGPAVPEPAPRPARRFLQVLDTYLIHETDDGMAIVDQHALHERVLYARLRDQWESGRLERQRLLVPEVVRLQPADLDRALSMADDLAHLGLEVSAFGDDCVAIHAVPPVLRGERLDELLGAMIHPPDLAVGEPHSLERRLFTMACHAAVKAGDPLDEDEAAALLAGGAALAHDATCPHGRPTRVVVDRGELERLFKRTGF